MRTPLLLSLPVAGLIALCALALCSPARAAEWPGNFLGAPDNAYRVLHIGVYYYAAVLHDLPDEQGAKPLPEGTDWLAAMAALPELTPEAMQAEQARVREQLNEAARFYWRNSRFNCAFDYTWSNDYTPRLRSSIAADDAPYYGPQCPGVYEDAMKQYDGLVQICVLYAYDKTTGALKRVKGGGGFTYGCDLAKRTCGWSWWAACPADNVCGSDWLMVHEFGHQLDSLFDASGHPEFWFNHLALSEGNVARFGEHFDANAYILRRAPEADWLDLQWGDLRHFADNDHDGVPLGEQWFSERGYLSDPMDPKPDADGDGLSDYHEYMAGNGNRLGHGDRLFPALMPCDPLNTDSDGDGIADGADALPMFPGGEFIPRHVAGEAFVPNYVGFPDAPDNLEFAVELEYAPDKWDEAAGKDIPGRFNILLYWSSGGSGSGGIIAAGESGGISSSGGVSAADISGRQDAAAMAGRQDAAPTGREVKLMLDLQNNGWFAGDDNYRITVNADGVMSVRQSLAASATEWPRDDDTTIDKTKLGFERIAAHAPFTTGVKLTLTKEMLKELALKPGAEIGLNIGLRKADEPWFYMLADPNTLMRMEMR